MVHAVCNCGDRSWSSEEVEEEEEGDDEVEVDDDLWKTGCVKVVWRVVNGRGVAYAVGRRRNRGQWSSSDRDSSVTAAYAA
jgi:hypothetical protein